MRHFHVLKNRTYTKTVNVEKLWSLLGHDVYETAKSGSKAPLLDVTKMVRGFPDRVVYAYAIRCCCLLLL
jgi:hypothetical protein